MAIVTQKKNQNKKKNSPIFCSYPVRTDLFLKILLPEKLLIIPLGLHISHSGAHCSCRYLGSIWQAFNYVLYSLWLTTQIVFCRDLNFKVNSEVIRTLTGVPLAYFFRNYDVDLTYSASRNNPMCSLILKKYSYLIGISCNQSGTWKTRMCNSEISKNQHNCTIFAACKLGLTIDNLVASMESWDKASFKRFNSIFKPKRKMRF